MRAGAFPIVGFSTRLIGLWVCGATAVRAENSCVHIELERLESFAKVYGYVRFFHPSDQAADIDWLALAVDGVKRMRERGETDSSEVLRTIFGPVAPTAVFSESAVALPSPTRMAERRIFWQHAGIRFETVGVSRRVIPGSTGATAPVFPTEPPANATVVEEVGPGVWISIPVTLPVEAGQTVPHVSEGFAELQARLRDVDTGRASIADANARIAGVIIVWNTLRHFSCHGSLENQPLRVD